MLPTVKGPTERFLAETGRMQATLDDVQRRLSSTIRVGRASDDPTAIPEILNTLSDIGNHRQMLANLNLAKTELLTGDAALSQAVKAVEHAIVIAAQASSTLESADRTVLMEQVREIRERLITAANTNSGGRYIFSGDLDQQPQYELDASDPNGVKRLTTPTSTRAVADSSGSTMWVAPTAGDLFDLRNADDSPAEGNVFQAISDLLGGLENADIAATAAASEKLKKAAEHLGRQQGLLGIAQNRVEDAETVVSRHLVSQQQALSELRDADVAAEATLLTQLDLQREASLSAQAKISQMGLFDYLG